MITKYNEYANIKLNLQNEKLYEFLGLGKLWAGIKNYVKNIKGVGDIDKIFNETVVKIDAEITKLTGLKKEEIATKELDKEVAATPVAGAATGTTVGESAEAGLNKQKYDNVIKSIDIIVKQYDISTAGIAKKYNTAKTQDYVQLKKLELEKVILDKKDKMIDSLGDENAKNTLKAEIKKKRLENEKTYKTQADKIKNESATKTELSQLTVGEKYDYTNSEGKVIKVELIEKPDELKDADKKAENDKITEKGDKFVLVKGATEFHVRWNQLKGGKPYNPAEELPVLEINKKYNYTNSKGEVVEVTVVETPDALTEEKPKAENAAKKVDGDKLVRVKGTKKPFYAYWKDLKEIGTKVGA